jgi:hypothetical protein
MPSQNYGQCNPTQLYGEVTHFTTGRPNTIVTGDPRLGMDLLGTVPLAGEPIVAGIGSGLPGQMNPSQQSGDLGTV